MLTQANLFVPSLGACRYETPLDFDSPSHPGDAHFLADEQRIRMDLRVGEDSASQSGELVLEEAGPRRRIFFAPPQTTAALVTCGGLSPGLNNVIRSVYEELTGELRSSAGIGNPEWLSRLESNVRAASDRNDA